MKSISLYILALFSALSLQAQQLNVIEQNYAQAKALAETQGKLLFVDFYTTWCKPCKELDRWVFQNDSAANLLAENFILLRYDAEQDTTFHLSKKHHVFSYPSAVVLTSDGYHVDRKYGFSGDDSLSTIGSVMTFADSAVVLAQRNELNLGYVPAIDPSIYPQFYVDYVNRVDTKPKGGTAFSDYWRGQHDVTSEAYFSTAFYFSQDVPDSNTTNFLAQKDTLIELYGQTDVDIMLMFMAIGRADRAVSAKDRVAFEASITCAQAAMNAETQAFFIPKFREDFAKATQE